MLVFSSIIVLVAFAFVVSGLTLEHIENNKICTAWQYVSGGTSEVDSSVCSGSLD